jgi:hypothetical protein
MNKLLVLLIINSLLYCHSNSQDKDEETIRLHSLENKNVRVKIKYDNVNDKIILELNPNEKAIVKGYRGLTQEVKILNQKFIEFQFDMRGGTGFHVSRYILFCVSENRLIRSIDIVSVITSVFKETYVPSIDSLHLYDESSSYLLYFSDLTERNNSYQLIVKDSVKIKSKFDPSQNYEYQDTTQLHFDMINKVFYNKYETLNGSYLIWSDENLNEQVNFNNEKLPSICIGQDPVYVYFRNKWFVKTQDYHLEDTDFNH